MWLVTINRFKQCNNIDCDMDHEAGKFQFTTKLIFNKLKPIVRLKQFVLPLIKVKLFSEESNLIYYQPLSILTVMQTVQWIK